MLQKRRHKLKMILLLENQESIFQKDCIKKAEDKMNNIQEIMLI